MKLVGEYRPRCQSLAVFAEHSKYVSLIIVVYHFVGPQFTSPFNESYTQSVDENIASSTAIVELSASDADNDALTFSIVNTVINI